MFGLYDEIPIGIDLGTTHSCIGYWNGKEVKIIPNRIGEKTTPSIIYFMNDNNEYLIGERINKYAAKECQKIYSVKRIIGRDFNDKNLENEIKPLNYEIVKDNQTNRPLIPITQKGVKKLYSPTFLSSLILKKLVEDAEKLLTRPIKKVVIAVPAYFDDAQRNATIEAAKEADLEVLRIINEPTAAALSYGLGQNFCPFKNQSPSFSNLFRNNRESRKKIKAVENSNSFCLLKESKLENLKTMLINNANLENEKGKNIMVFDLGGGTFDLAILQLNFEKKEYEVKSKFSDKYLGGDNFDNHLVDHCLNKNGINRNNDKIEKLSMERLRNACEQAKKLLNYREEVVIRVDNFTQTDLITKVTKKEFEDEICKDLFDRLSMPFDELIEGANLRKENIDEIILVGGSTRMPKIKEILISYFKDKPINDNISPEEVVAYGATIQAAMLMTLGKNKILDGVKLFDITPISLGTDVVNKSDDPRIKALGNKMSVIIPKWTKIPIKKEKGYKTIKDYQETMQICIFEGENDFLKDNKLLEKFTLVDLPKRPKGEVQCTVTFEIDVNNILNVTAVETSKGITNKIKVKSSNKENSINRKSFGSLTSSQIDEELNNLDFDLEKYINNYQNFNDIKKITILENYNQILLSGIKKINPNENENGINGDNVEKYFFYIYQLFESYEEMLYLLQKDGDRNEGKKNKILENVKKYIDLFKTQNSYYIKQFVELFSNIEDNMFLEILLQAIKNFNEMGKYYIENQQKHSRYYAKLYYEEVINLIKKYNILDKEGLYDFMIMSKIKEEFKKSEIQLTDINSNAISLINKSKNEKKLLDQKTGFTYLHDKVSLGNQKKDYDEYNLMLDELERINSELDILIKKASQNKNLRNDLFEQQGICIGNIVTIKFSYLNGEKYSEYLNSLKVCLFYAKSSGNNRPEVKWYQDALELKDKIEEKKREKDEEISNNIEDELRMIDNVFNQENKMDFINYILEYWPYNEYNMYTRPSYYNWNTLNRELISFLSSQYHPDLYPRNTPEERNRYRIIESISKRLNNILEQTTPDKIFILK